MNTIDDNISKEREEQPDDSRYWLRWYISLLVWLVILILLFYWFTKVYS